MIRYLDVCSGYSAFTQANEGLGYECLGYAEIEAFPAALLGAHYGATRAIYMPDPDAPDLSLSERDNRTAMRKSMATLPESQFGDAVRNFGDFTQIREDDIDGPVHLLTGGTPCQAFSVAGKRLGLDDPRGNLTLEFLALAQRVRAEWLLWENVPGFLSHDDGRTMGTFLRLLGQCGYGFAYRVLDAQYIRVDGLPWAVPQRRRRLFIVAHLGDAAGPAAVLFDRESLRGDPAPCRETGEGITHAVAPNLVASGRGVERTGETRGQDPVVGIAFGGGNTSSPLEIATARTAHANRIDFDSETFIAETAGTLPAGGNSTGGERHPGTSADTAGSMLVAHSLRAEGFDASEDGTGRGTPLVPVCVHSDAIGRTGIAANPSMDAEGNMRLRDAGMGISEGVAFNLTTGQPHAVAHRHSGNAGSWETGDRTDALTACHDSSAQHTVTDGWAVRRLTPLECERLMGVKDGLTAIMYRGKPASDGPRYKALGNSQARNQMRWLARGLAEVIAVQS